MENAIQQIADAQEVLAKQTGLRPNCIRVIEGGREHIALRDYLQALELRGITVELVDDD